jgi:hypothetical protein
LAQGKTATASGKTGKKRQMSSLATLFRTVGRTLFRIEVTFILLLLAMTAIGRANDLDAQIKVALGDAVQTYYAEQVITAMDGDDAATARGESASAALPVSR